MTRVIIGTTGTSSVAEQIFTTDVPRILEVQFQPHPGNASKCYIGTSSAVSAANGWGFDTGTTWKEPLKITADVKGTTYWAFSPDTVSLIDYVCVVDP